MDLHNHIITRGVFKGQHHGNTQDVFNVGMKTIGERIRQARSARGMSQQELADAVGYSKQSSIGNLEVRATGNGGNKIVDIARVLRVPIDWLLGGPDGTEVPYSNPIENNTGFTTKVNLQDQEEKARYQPDASIEEVILLFKRLNTSQRMQTITYMQSLVTEVSQAKQPESGDRDPVPHKKAA